MCERSKISHFLSDKSIPEANRFIRACCYQLSPIGMILDVVCETRVSAENELVAAATCFPNSNNADVVGRSHCYAIGTKSDGLYRNVMPPILQDLCARRCIIKCNHSAECRGADKSAVGADGHATHVTGSRDHQRGIVR